MSDAKLVPVGISNRHVHLSEEHLAVLFGSGATLTKMKDLSQPGQFAAEEVVEVVGPKGAIGKVRVLGPVRKASQVEISLTDSFALGVKAPVRDSGQHEGTPGCTLRGPKGEVTLEQGVIIAARHIHLHTSEAEQWGLKDGDRVKVRTKGERSLVFENVLCRVHPSYALDMHVDTDEGNAAALRNGDLAEIIKEA